MSYLRSFRRGDTAIAERPLQSGHLSPERIAEAVRFLSALYANADGAEYLEFRPLTPVKDSKANARMRSWVRIEDIRQQGWERIIPDYLDGFANVYFGVNLRKRDGGGRMEDASSAHCIWADEAKLHLLPDFPEPSITVETSPGKFQHYWLLDEPATGDDLALAEHVARTVAALTDADTVGDNARLMRVPGFANVKPQHKRGGVSPVARVLEFSERRYSLAALIAALPDMPPLVESSPPPPADVTMPVSSFAAAFVASGAPYGEQRTAALRTARVLWRAGIDEEEAARLVLQGLGRSAQDAARPWTERDVTALVADIYHSAPRPFKQPAPTPEPVAAPVEEEHKHPSRERKAAAARRRRLLAERVAHRYENPEFNVIDSLYVKLGVCAPGAALELDPETLSDLLADCDANQATRARSCANFKVTVCAADGSHPPVSRSQWECELPFCHRSLTPTAKRLAIAALPDLEGTALYRTVHLEAPVSMGAADGWLERLTAPIAPFQAHVDRIRGRKAWKGKVNFRSTAFALGTKVSAVQYRVQFVEDAPGDANEAIEDMRARLRAVVTYDDSTASGDEAVIESMDATRTLLGMEALDNRLFRDFWWATKGRHLFSAFGPLLAAMNAAVRAKKAEPPEEPRVCTVCSSATRTVMEQPDGTRVPVPESMRPSRFSTGVRKPKPSAIAKGKRHPKRGP